MDIVSFVFQDSFLFFDTLYENIRVGNSSAGREEVIAAAKAAQCHEFIESLPQGYEMRASTFPVASRNVSVWQGLS